jgi:hypothetical protein
VSCGCILRHNARWSLWHLFLQKIISALLKDLDVFARNSIKDELASLDPLLRNVGGWGGSGPGDEAGRAMDDYDQ